MKAWILLLLVLGACPANTYSADAPKRTYGNGPFKKALKTCEEGGGVISEYGRQKDLARELIEGRLTLQATVCFPDLGGNFKSLWCVNPDGERWSVLDEYEFERFKKLLDSNIVLWECTGRR